jgi:peptide/nickel transport system permease protein
MGIKGFNLNIDFVMGVIILLLFALVAIIAPFVAPANSENPYLVRLTTSDQKPEPPQSEHPLGTLPGKYDIFYGLVWGTRMAFLVGIIITLGRALIGVLVGMISGYAGGYLDAFLMRLTDAFLAIPVVAMGAVVMALFSNPLVVSGRLTGFLLSDRTTQLLLLTLVVFGWMQYARLIRGNILIEREKDYVLAATSVGATDRRILFKHLLPNVTQGLFVLMASEVGAMIVLVAVFRFIGLVISTSGIMMADWGEMLSASRNWIVPSSNNAFEYWYTYVPASVAIVLFSFGWNLVGDGLRQALDPTQKPSWKFFLARMRKQQ